MTYFRLMGASLNKATRAARYAPALTNPAMPMTLAATAVVAGNYLATVPA